MQPTRTANSLRKPLAPNCPYGTHMLYMLQAKRAAREAKRGFDARVAVGRLQDFVAREGDLMVMEPVGKHGQVGTQSLLSVRPSLAFILHSSSALNVHGMAKRGEAGGLGIM